MHDVSIHDEMINPVGSIEQGFNFISMNEELMPQITEFNVDGEANSER